MTVIQAELFNVGDRVRPYDSSETLIVRDVEIRRGRTLYLVEEPTSMFGRSLGAWWATHDELQPAREWEASSDDP
jgi:hypothetical protein